MSPESKAKYPQDLVAIFHASFHPTRGHVIDWSMKASDDLNLDNLEFSALPSGLHLVEQDVVYFTKDSHHGVCVFRRRKTIEHGHRGFRLSSLGILLAKSQRPRPWRHLAMLKDLVSRIHLSCEDSGTLHPTESGWDPARVFFEERKVRRADLGGAGEWRGWSHELFEVAVDPPSATPTLHLPHLLRILGPSSLTLYKHVLGRRRILLYTQPPVEAACILCHVAADLCFEAQVDSASDSREGLGRLRGRNRDPISVLGMVTLSDLERLRVESVSGRGWIACTTDALFLEKPACYDLLIDLATNKGISRPTFYASKPLPPTSPRGPTHRLSTIRFAWSDVRLWNELDRILLLDSAQHYSSHSHSTSHNPQPSSSSASPSPAPHHHHHHHHHQTIDDIDPCFPQHANSPLKSKLITTWTDAWRVYEDVCVICAGLLMGSWRSNSYLGGGSGLRLEGEDELNVVEGAGSSGKVGAQSAYVRSLGMGIEGRPVASGSGELQTGSHRRSSGMSWSSGRATVIAASSSSGIGNGKARQVSSASTAFAGDGAGINDATEEEREEERERERERGLLTTLSLLQTFHAHTAFQLSVLESFIPRQPAYSDNSTPSASAGPPPTETNPPPTVTPTNTVYLAPKDVLAFELGPLSAFDARYLEWLGQEYGGDTRVVVKRGWRDLLGALLGYA